MTTSFTMNTGSSSKRPIVIAIVIGALLIAIGVAVGLAVGLSDDGDNNSDDHVCNSCASSAGSAGGDGHQDGGADTDPVYKSAIGTYNYASVVADSALASHIGNTILARHGGNAFDAAVAATFATSVINPHSAGVGGGGFIVLYDRESNEGHAIDSRETAPSAATENMYGGDRRKTFRGGLAIGVPGEVKGLWEMHQRFGRLQWRDVIAPTIKLCQEGVPLSKSLSQALNYVRRSDPWKDVMAQYYGDDGRAKPVGTPIPMPKLAATLQKIADDPESFYSGSLAQDIVEDLKEAGSIITVEDLKDYTVSWKTPSRLDLPGNFSILSMPLPGSGVVLTYILSILAGYNMGPESVSTTESEILTYHRIVEAFKFAYAKKTQLGDEDFVDVSEHVANMTSLEYGEWTRAQISDWTTYNSSHYHATSAGLDNQGTTSLSVLDGQGNAVAITTSVNFYFGSRKMGSRTGIIFNNIMADFSIPDTSNSNPTNYIAPGKRPQSSMTPTLVLDGNNQAMKMVTGASGGSRITTTLALNIMDVLWFNRSLPDSVDRPRVHHQFLPDRLQVEGGFPEDIVDGLKDKGHEIGPYRGVAVVQAIDVAGDSVVAAADFRKGGQPDGY